MTFDTYAPWWLIMAIVFYEFILVQLPQIPLIANVFLLCRVNILIQNIIQVVWCILSLDFTYDWISTKGYSKHELSTIMLSVPKNKRCIRSIPPPPHHNGHLSKTATFLCPRGGLCGEVWLYLSQTHIVNKSIVQQQLTLLLTWYFTSASTFSKIKTIH